MAFINAQVSLEDLPQAEQLKLEPMAPAYQSEVKTQQLIIWSPLVLVAFLPRFQHGVTSPMPRGSAVSHSPQRRELMVGESRCIISLA